MRKNAHSVFPQNRFWVKGAIGWVFRVPAPIWGCYALLRSWAQYPHLPIAPTAFTEAACPPSPPACPASCRKVPARTLPFRRYHSVLVDKAAFFSVLFSPGPFWSMLLTGALCAVQPNKEFTVFVKWLPALAVLGVLYAYPAHAAEPLEDASEALENLDDLVKSVDSVGHSFGRIVQPRQYGFRWNGGEIGRDSNPSRMPRNSRSQDDRRGDDRDDD